MTSSISSLAVGKILASTQTMENYNLDNDWNSGTSSSTGGGGQVGVQKTDGTIRIQP